ncbi:glycoside hydrolase [Vararia minispora EC-137]|uniref:Glycoside hydrolase n=1 Tax=Vararia minispora EC-137 TaxID=1314806 RepID=A0ACB8QQB0_9AGAM|nr:glycoside hydrolase [Vararia minispora EC-137]
MVSHTPSEASFILVGDSQMLPERSAALEQTRQPPNTHPSEDPSYRVGSSPSYAHDWSSTGVGGRISAHGRHFVDVFGRVLTLHGVNLAGSCKISPANHDHDTFPAHPEAVTFVNRPFPLGEAHEHLARLRRWGLTFVRVLVTWEAVEHEGPGLYDNDYLEYLRSLISLFPLYGITCFVNMHQDVWSRYSGGSGAPAWTLEAVGFDLLALEECGAGWLRGVRGGGHIEAERGVWPTGYQKLSAATMATLFWAGDTFAPKLRIRTREGKETSAQQFLQNAYLDMWEVVARTLGDLDAVLGFEIMNEPHHGYINLPSLHEFNYNTDLHLSHVPTALQSFLLGAGYPTEVAFWTRSFPLPTRHTSTSILNSASRKAWREDGPTGGRDIWEMHGVWGYDMEKKAGVVLRENYFVKDPMTDKPVDWYTDCYFPFINRWTNRVRSASSSDKLVFLEPIPNEFCPRSWGPEQPANMIYAPHWYDLRVLFEKAHGDFSVNVQGLSRGMFFLKAFYWGHKGARENFSLQIRNIVEEGYKSLGERPIVIGECGVPMDMNKGEAFTSGDFKWQSRMMDAMITGLERSLVGFTLWTYNPDNNDIEGDHWNGEHFSWFSRARAPDARQSLEQSSEILDAGARILESVVRPYAAKTAGIPLHAEYEMTTGRFKFSWAVPSSASNAIPSGGPRVDTPPRDSHVPLLARETEIFLPAQLTKGRKVIVRGLAPGDTWNHDEARQTLFILPKERIAGRVHSIDVSVEPPLDLFTPNDLLSDFGICLWALGGILVAMLLYFIGAR